MATAATVVVAMCSSPHVINIQNIHCSRKNYSYPARISAHNLVINNNRSLRSSASELLICRWKGAARTKREQPNGVLVVPRAEATVGTEDFIVEPTTNVKFLTSLKAPGGSSSLSLAGTVFGALPTFCRGRLYQHWIGVLGIVDKRWFLGASCGFWLFDYGNAIFMWNLVRSCFREKKIAIISVKVYAAGLYVDTKIKSYLDAWSGNLGSQIEHDNLFFNAIFEAPVEKSLQIVLVRDIDGETFWGALDEALSPRLKTTGAAEQKALDIFSKTFQGRSLK